MREEPPPMRTGSAGSKSKSRSAEMRLWANTSRLVAGCLAWACCWGTCCRLGGGGSGWVGSFSGTQLRGRG